MRYVMALLALGISFGNCWAQRHPASPTRPPVGQPAETQAARYARLDQLARQLPEAQATSLDKLTAALAAQARSDDDKARLIFTWIACHVAYDVAYLQSGVAPQTIPEQVLQTRRAICQGYAELFTALAGRMKLAAQTVAGHASTDPTGATSPVLGTDNGHAWNVYRVGDSFHLADACWGAGYVSDDYRTFTFKFEPFWFDTSPAQAVFSHRPDEAAWQLLPVPVEAATFQRWPYVPNEWFELGIGGASMRRALVPVKGQPKPRPLPRLNPTLHEVRLVQVPRPATLVAGQPVVFVFMVGPGVEVGLEGQDFEQSAATRGPYRRLVVTPTIDKPPHIVTWQQKDSTEYTLLEYQVARPPAHRPGVADSLSYLRR